MSSAGKEKTYSKINHPARICSLNTRSYLKSLLKFNACNDSVSTSWGFRFASTNRVISGKERSTEINKFYFYSISSWYYMAASDPFCACISPTSWNLNFYVRPAPKSTFKFPEYVQSCHITRTIHDIRPCDRVRIQLVLQFALSI